MTQTRHPKFTILDHGYIRLVEAWGVGDAGEMEAGIIEAARQSTQGAFRGWEKDEKLLRTLFMSEPQHGTPFEFAGMVIEVQAPIMVFREWHRHRTQGYNEMSARYAPLPDLVYVPDATNLVARSAAAVHTRNKQQQGTSEEPISYEKALEWLDKLERLYSQAEQLYKLGLEWGVPKELARLPMPVGHYSRMRAVGNLRNWLGFLTLRYHPDAQEEIRRYATVLGEQIIDATFPHVWALFDEKRELHRLREWAVPKLPSKDS